MLYLAGDQQRGSMLMVCNFYLPRDIFLPVHTAALLDPRHTVKAVSSLFQLKVWSADGSPLSLSEKSFPKLNLPRLVHAAVICALGVVWVVQLSFISLCFYLAVLSFQQILALLLLGPFTCQ